MKKQILAGVMTLVANTADLDANIDKKQSQIINPTQKEIVDSVSDKQEDNSIHFSDAQADMDAGQPDETISQQDIQKIEDYIKKNNPKNKVIERNEEKKIMLFGKKFKKGELDGWEMIGSTYGLEGEIDRFFKNNNKYLIINIDNQIPSSAQIILNHLIGQVLLGITGNNNAKEYPERLFFRKINDNIYIIDLTKLLSR